MNTSMKIPEGGRKMNKPPYTYFEVERRDYWSGTRLVGMLVGVMLMLAVFGVIFMSCDLKPAHAVEIDLDVIAQIESSGNPLAYNSYSKAKGLYQITPICLADYNAWYSTAKIDSNALFSPKEARLVAGWYLGIRIPQMLKIKAKKATIRNILWAYNAGIGNVVKGVMPKETKNYIKKYELLTMPR